uniref:Uncharacterized protein n=1 Tax=Rhizophora mucronata TaxID=61149 RepID=A0A2P2PZ24_RHIMU
MIAALWSPSQVHMDSTPYLGMGLAIHHPR